MSRILEEAYCRYQGLLIMVIQSSLDLLHVILAKRGFKAGLVNDMVDYITSHRGYQPSLKNRQLRLTSDLQKTNWGPQHSQYGTGGCVIGAWIVHQSNIFPPKYRIWK